MRHKKSLGQHFLIQPEYAQRLAESIEEKTTNLVEVGPGPGMLTQFLVDRASKLVLIEKDSALARAAKTKWAGASKVSVIEGDILTVDLDSLFDGNEFTIAGNFPYNISSQIVFRVLDLYPRVPEMIGMFQYEMARRIVSGPGTKDYGIISVLTALKYESDFLYKVPPSAFDPPPKVNSAVIRLRARPLVNLPCNYQSLRVVVKAAFGMRRKMLRNSLKALMPDELLHEKRFEKRPEQTDLSEFIDLAMLFEKVANSK